MKMYKNGFTLSEILIVIGLVGVVSAIVLSTLVHNKPNQNKAMFKKAYYIVERNVGAMIMDDDHFPMEVDDGSKGLAYFDASADVDDNDPNVRNMKNSGKYFCRTFASQLNTVSTVNCEAAAASATVTGSAVTPSLGEAPSFETSDGVSWYITPNKICDPDDTVANPSSSPCTRPDSDTPECPDNVDAKQPYVCVFFDVNGEGEPNSFIGLKGEPEVRDADRGFVYVYWNGKVEVPVGQASKYIKSVTVF